MEKKERNHNSYCELPEGEELSSPVKSSTQQESRKGKENRDIRILRKGKSIKERNDPERFCGEGVNFRAKIIGTENVFDARGNRMCQGALQRLKAAVKSSGDHKQKIILNISLEGIIIKDDKSKEQLHHHPIHKISFISQDTKDNRAFGYVYGCPQTGHQFFAIKTEKAASQVVVTLRDLFLVALEMKKSEIERNQNVEQSEDSMKKESFSHKSHENGITNGSVEIASASSLENKSENVALKHSLLYSNTVLLPEEELSQVKVSSASEIMEPDHSLLDLQSEVDILQQEIIQIDHSIATTISQNVGISFSEDDVSESSNCSIPAAFQFKLDKFASLYQETISISSRSSSTSDYNVGSIETKLDDNDTPKKEIFTSSAQAPLELCSSGVSSLSNGSTNIVSEEFNPENCSVVEDRYAVFLDIDSMPSIFDNPSIIKIPVENMELLNMNQEKCCNEKNELSTVSDGSEMEIDGIKSSTPVAFAELDPLGNQPYVDKRNFFQDIKNPPKKILKDLINVSSDFFPNIQSSSQENLKFEDSKGKTEEKVFTFKEAFSGGMPPKLPPKRSVAISNTVSSELQNKTIDSTIWESKNPFNPFLCEEYPDIPPPNSPPPPPPPRLATKGSELSPTLSSPPPRPPSRVCDIPTPPLPKRKVPLNSSNRTWFSFDQDASSLSTETFVPEIQDLDMNHAPPLPSPARKIPPPYLESSNIKSTSASSSPSNLRKLYNKSPHVGSSTITNEDSKICAITSAKKIFSRHSSTLHENDAVYNSVVEMQDPNVNILANSPQKINSLFQETDMFSSTVFNPFAQSNDTILKDTAENSPPLPPKPVSISRSRPSPLKRGFSVSSCSSSGVSLIESSNGTHSSSSLVFSSVDENKIGSSSEALFTNSVDSNSDVFPQSSKETEIRSSNTNDIVSQNNKETEVKQDISPELKQPESSNGFTEDRPIDISPDSIFRRKSDPFADDFFLSLHKKSNYGNSNGVEEHFDNLEAPT